MGDDAFFGALKTFLREKQFQRASWYDLKTVFQKQSGRDLGGFFDQWLNGKGLPELEMNDLAVTQNARAFALNFDLSQKGRVYRLDVPVKVRYESGGEKNVRIRLEERKKRVWIDLEKEPSEVVIDENFDLARRLTAPEVLPVIASPIGAEKRIVALPVRDESYYKEVMQTFQARGAEVKAPESLSDAEIRSATLFSAWRRPSDSIDDYPVSSIEDVRIALFYKHPGDTIKVKAKRRDEELEFNVMLQ